ncbi:unnamed protein product [Cyprideis torosa]|uniref:Uncharacterized protein n=1 Tax=Cyprideis torosa TaxID=163714 RepID=A0A7R8WXG9_9CRUS|nr:unnamed protein product [Cyprideis torosa]CAG0911971.1 unnamed protein product [Cyprideis torosa]
MAAINLVKEDLESTINDNDIVIIDFWASWCGPCKSFAPTFEAASEKYEDIVFAKVNTEEQQELAAMFNIRSIPTLMVFRENVILYSEAGALPAGQFDELITRVRDVNMAEVHEQIRQQQENQA